MKPRKKAKRAPAKPSRKRAKKSFSVGLLIGVIEAQMAEIERLIEEMQQNDEMEISELLQLQFMVNLFSQLLETTTNITAAMHDAIEAMIRNIK